MEKNQVDLRAYTVRSGYVETTCDSCGEVILASESRHPIEIINTGVVAVLCQACLDDYFANVL